MIELDNLTKVFDTPKGAVVAADHISMDRGEICSCSALRAAGKPLP